MKDNRDDLIVIIAGTTGKMKTFLSSNPGLRSRFNKYFDFADYEPGQLVEIFELFCAEAGFRLMVSARDKLFSPRPSSRFTRAKTRVLATRGWRANSSSG